MKGAFKKILIVITVTFSALFAFAACSDEYILTETTFFRVMTNMIYYPGSYTGKTIEVDLFIYELEDVSGVTHTLAVRQCSGDYGCTCGQDKIIGFILNYGGDIPEAKNQSNDDPDKSWVHLKGMLDSAEFTEITIYAYDSNGNVDKEADPETVLFLTFNADELTEIDGSDLAYYVLT